MALGGGPVLGMEFGDGFIRAAAARKARRGYALSTWAERDAPTGGVFAPPADLGPVLRELADEIKAGTDRVVFSLSNQHILLRRVVLPRLRPARLRRMLEEEGRSFIPFLPEGAALDVRVLGPAPEPRDARDDRNSRAESGKAGRAERRLEVLLAAVPTRVVTSLQEACAVAGLELAGLELDLVSTFRALQADETLTTQPMGLVYLGDRRARLAVFYSGQPAVVRSLETPSERVSELSAGVGRLLELTLEARAPALQHIILCGPAASAELAGTLAETLPIELGRRLEEDFRIQTVTVPAEVTGAEGATAAFGAALAPAIPPGLMDLLPRPTFLQVQARRRRLVYRSMGALLVGLYGWWWSQAVPAGQAELHALTAERATQARRVADLRHVRDLEQQIRQLQPVLREMTVLAVPLSEAYTGLAGLLPAGTALTDIGGSLPDLRVRGLADEPELVDELLVRLAGSPLVREVFLQNATRGEIRYSFELVVRLHGKEVEGIAPAKATANDKD